jgi:1-aminocyclopropane-1-carboxylate deaminase
MSTALESLTAAISEPALESLTDPFLKEHNVRIDLLRLDKIHPLVNGNKWFKLKLNLQKMLDDQQDTLLSFGGAYSNHIRASAAAASLLNLKSIGVIRGELPSPLNPVLQFAQEMGMQLHSISRGDYRLKQSPAVLNALKDQFGEFYLIPEGGSNELGVKGCETIAEIVSSRVTAGYEASNLTLAIACGTGATLAGIIRGAAKTALEIDLIGIAVLKGGDFLRSEVDSWLDNDQTQNSKLNWRIELDYHFGGYAKDNATLRAFIERFEQTNQIQLEPVYTGKLLYGIYDLIQKGVIAPGSQVIAVHTGGV